MNMIGEEILGYLFFNVAEGLTLLDVINVVTDNADRATASLFPLRAVCS